MSEPRNPELIDATKLVFGFDYDGFQPWPREDIEEVNASHPKDPSSIIGISDRSASTYDPAQKCVVIAGEMLGSGQNGPNGEILDGHLVALLWDDEQGTECLIDVDTGEVWEVKELAEDQTQYIDIDLDASPEWRHRIIMALSELARERTGL